MTAVASAPMKPKGLVCKCGCGMEVTAKKNGDTAVEPQADKESVMLPRDAFLCPQPPKPDTSRPPPPITNMKRTINFLPETPSRNSETGTSLSNSQRRKRRHGFYDQDDGQTPVKQSSYGQSEARMGATVSRSLFSSSNPNLTLFKRK